jgi:hypothetical protein
VLGPMSDVELKNSGLHVPLGAHLHGFFGFLRETRSQVNCHADGVAGQ